jgi:hypothetical protein
MMWRKAGSRPTSSWPTRRICCSSPRHGPYLAKLAHGLADDALGCIALALNPEAKLLIAPAMNGKMWLHPATQANVALLKERGAEFIGPEKGLLVLRLRRHRPPLAGGKNRPKRRRLAPVNEEPKQDFIGVGTIQKLTRLLAAPVIEPSQRAARILAVEKDIVLPLRLLIIAILGYYFFFLCPGLV